MLNFKLRLFNYPSERLFNPRKKLNGINIPFETTKLLPFKNLPFEKIEEEIDCIKFLEFFNDLGFDNVADLKEYILKDDLYISYKENSNDSNTIIQLITIIKYLFVSKRLLQCLTANDSAFSFHLPFLAEAVYDLESSYYLMQGGYFKQSLQTLRSVLEITLLHAYFGLKYLDNEMMDNEMKKQYPTLKEMIVFFRSEKLLNDKLEQEYFKLYKFLSLAVHSEITKLNVSRSFEYKEVFSEWYNSFISVAVLNINTIIRMVKIGI